MSWRSIRRSRSARLAFRMHVARVSASFKHGITTDTSGVPAPCSVDCLSMWRLLVTGSLRFMTYLSVHMFMRSPRHVSDLGIGCDRSNISLGLSMIRAGVADYPHHLRSSYRLQLFHQRSYPTPEA